LQANGVSIFSALSIHRECCSGPFCRVSSRNQRYRICDLVVNIKSTQWQEKGLSTESSINIILSIILRNLQKLDRLCVSFSLAVCVYVEYGRKKPLSFYEL